MKKINQDSIWFKAVKLQSDFCDAGLPNTICTYWVRVFSIFVLFPIYVYLLVSGLWIVIGPGSLNDGPFLLVLAKAVTTWVTFIMSVVVALYFIARAFENCEYIDYD